MRGTGAMVSAYLERALVFECEGEQLVGIVAAPEAARVGVLVIVGGPQYRAGSHRQYVLLSRRLASAGVAGASTLRPGIWAQSAVQSCECWAPYLLPTEQRSTTGTRRIPADIECHLAIWLKISSPARPMKSPYISSMRLRPPSSAWPTAVAMIAASEIGELKRRS